MDFAGRSCKPERRWSLVTRLVPSNNTKDGSVLTRLLQTYLMFFTCRSSVVQGAATTSHLFIPNRNKLAIAIGPPTDVQRTEAPTDHQIDDLHSASIKAIKDL